MEDKQDMREAIHDDPQDNNSHSSIEEGHKAKDANRKADKRKVRIEDIQKELDEKQMEYNILYDKHLRLLSEFDNYRKRTIKERAELLKTAGEDVILALLPVLDDMERAWRSTTDLKDPSAIREGIQLIMNKMTSTLAQKGLEPIEAVGQEFNTDFHEAITDIPAPSEDMKGKVIDEIEKGFTLGGKVIRFSKVVVGK